MTKPRDHWAKVFGPESKLADACVAPILTLAEVKKKERKKERSNLLRTGAESSAHASEKNVH